MSKYDQMKKTHTNIIRTIKILKGDIKTTLQDHKAEESSELKNMELILEKLNENNLESKEFRESSAYKEEDNEHKQSGILNKLFDKKNQKRK